MSQHAAVLFANEAFYLAFRNRDSEAMEALWAEGATVACIHPGWQAVVGREAVLESWRAILGGQHAPVVRLRGARATLTGEVGIVLCYEEIEGSDSLLVATNLFLREDGAWRLIHHQAGPTPLRPDQVEDPEAEAPLQ
ncbi:Ketosteroid isomerase homolog [Tistlia consotensis]|uniref:Ketosteroid isomerase homolog n=1 Tax=Tistlia consotensis USBA 355 TaxID=560819 RepID=A0A1Y6CKG0_9PROT|nr:nuclear transport factor 2 family protein [Tistlia consotensis]SMF71414.1 Ketosteroid isomerase homolog [Tistlia consotensis USBA 355]SNS06708.1 Ketosteroid isomerase homolog [Tistlia consotensis]